MAPTYQWRGEVGNAELEALHAEAFEHRPVEYDWNRQLTGHSLGWVTAREAGTLIGFVNVAWDGGAHAFILDTATAVAARHHGFGAELVRVAAEHARQAGSEWLHVDFDPGLEPFYLRACGFAATSAGLIQLRGV